MKSKPFSPERLSRRVIILAAVNISECSIKRKTVAGPAELLFLSTSKWRPARTVPFQQAIVLVASRPVTNACAFTTDRRRSSDGQISVLSRSTKARLAARIKSGGAWSARKASSASSSVCTIRTPSPPEVQFALRTVGKPIRATHFLRSWVVVMTSVSGTRMPSSWASCMKVVLAYTTGKLSGAPRERSITRQISAPPFP